MELQPSYMDSVYSSELYHHGILGQKWGVRKYQNSDGSLTEAGKARYTRREERKARREAVKAEKRADKLERRGNWKGPDTFINRRRNKLADRGDDLRAQGTTIGSNNAKTFIRGGAIALGAGVTSLGLAGTNIRLRWGNTVLANINSSTAIKAGRALYIANFVKGYSDNRAIRASYARDRDSRKRWKDKKRNN